jgi:hypothetical protein
MMVHDIFMAMAIVVQSSGSSSSSTSQASEMRRTPAHEQVRVEQVMPIDSRRSEDQTEMPQVKQDGRQAIEPSDLSSRRNSPPPPAAQIGGSDRCDPSHAADRADRSPLCAHPIESRASEYRRSVQPRFPDGRLLIQQDPGIAEVIGENPASKPRK